MYIKLNIQNDGAHALGYIKDEIQYISYFLTEFDHICAKMLVF